MNPDIISCECGHRGPAHSNGYARWCPKCQMNNRFKTEPNPHRYVNGNLHEKNMERFDYDGLTVVTESPEQRTVRVTVYRGDDPVPLSTELYGLCGDV